jgi:cytochrome c biogenesis protein CcmG, thiol:disulfide interchange protein DsbE
LMAVPALTACADDAAISNSTYSYDPGDAAVDVDTAQLRAQKAEAGIPDCPKVDADAAAVDGGVPAITLPCLGGGRDVDLAGLTGEPTVLNFWAQTCGPCRQESPLFQQLHETGDVRVLGVDFYDPIPGKALAFADELGLTYPQIADPEAATRAPMRVQGLPMTVFVDEDGQVTHVEYGAVQSPHDLATLVQAYLDVDVELR